MRYELRVFGGSIIEPPNTLSYIVFFSSLETKNLFKNVHSLNVCKLPFLQEIV